MRKIRLAVDIGGTFTDVALELADGSKHTTKVLTTHHAPAEGVMAGIQEVIAETATPPNSIGMIIHGTTLATNSLIERRGATTALLTTEGHRDSLEMAYENRFEQYDINIDRPKPLVPRWLRLPVRERMNRDGNVLVPLDRQSVLDTLPILERENVESVAIGFLHAYANRSHEEQVAELLSKERPDLSLTLASEVAPEIREYERLSTAVANAYVRPLMERYLHDLSSSLLENGFTCPFYLISSGAGLLTVEAASKFPIRLVESGPAGGAVLASNIARECNAPSVISFDMGGTTAKLCLIDQYEPKTSRTFEVDRSYRFKKGSGLPVRIPVIEMVEIGAGGGSIASIDKLGRVQTGPESAGSNPGPAAYGLGGLHPAITDADIVQGKIMPKRFAGGNMHLDQHAAKYALETHIAQSLGVTAIEAAFAVSEVVDENMSNAARAHAVEQGADTSNRSMIAFGGAAPLHACRLAEKLGINTVIVPANAGVGSAIGFLLTPASYEVVRSRYMQLEKLDTEEVEKLFLEMHHEASEIISPALEGHAAIEKRLSYMRYSGQGHEIAVPIEEDFPKNRFASYLQEAFEREYERLFGRVIPNMPIEALTWSLVLQGPRYEHDLTKVKEVKPVTISSKDKTLVYEPATKSMIEYAVYDRTNLNPGATFTGPALIVEAQTTIVVTNSFNVSVLNGDHIRLERKVSDKNDA
ncbi:MAG: hydantoinase/oxoprolinase family protein [Aquisalinus sp.]|nr:hydantoinase/oxoprolinase family protein [Aquisalinus sp.]